MRIFRNRLLFLGILVISIYNFTTLTNATEIDNSVQISQNYVISDPIISFKEAHQLHSIEDYDSAIEIYDLLLSSENSESDILEALQISLELAEKNIPIRGANKEVIYLRSLKSVSEKYSESIESAKIYFYDTTILKEADISLVNLINWTKYQHNIGNFEIALSRYNLIMDQNTHINNSDTLLEVENLRDKALNNVMATAEDHFNYSNAINTVSARYTAFKNGMSEYSSNTKIVEGYKDASYKLLIWTQNQHALNNIEVALGRYDLLLDDGYLDDNYRLSAVNGRLLGAENISIVPLSKMLINIREESSVSRRFNGAVEAMRLYSYDDRIVKELDTSTVSLLKWSKLQHSLGNFEVAESRYAMIWDLHDEINVNSQILSEVNMLLSKANHKVMISAEDHYKYANSINTVSARYIAFKNGMSEYSSSPKIIVGYEDASYKLLVWTQNQHSIGNIEIAASRYNVLIEDTFLRDEFRLSSESGLKLAAENKTFESINNTLTMIRTQTGVSGRYESAAEAMKIYSYDNRIVKEFEVSTHNLLKWSKLQHSAGKFDVAEIRYSMVVNLINETGLMADILEDVDLLLKQAKQNVMFTSQEHFEYSNAIDTISARYSAFLNGFKFYTESLEMRKEFINTANRLLIYAEYTHNKLSFERAILYYELLSQPGYTPNDIIYRANINKTYALKSMTILNSNTFIKNSEYIGYDNALFLQSNANQQTDLRGGWLRASSDEIDYYMNPSNFINPAITGAKELGVVEITVSSLNIRIGPGSNYTSISVARAGSKYSVFDEKDGWYQIWMGNQFGWIISNYANRIEEAGNLQMDVNSTMYQFLQLSGYSGLSSTEVNKVLFGKGILNNTGEYFINASQDFKVNEIYLIAHSLLETGNGSSELANGVMVTTVDNKPVEPRIVYNMFGIGAYDSNAIKLGSEYAYKAGWFTPESAIYGGANFIANNYIYNPDYKQDTLYKMRWNPAFPTKHQYATDIGWATKQTYRIKDLYSKVNGYRIALDIPLYK